MKIILIITIIVALVVCIVYLRNNTIQRYALQHRFYLLWAWYKQKRENRKLKKKFLKDTDSTIKSHRLLGLLLRANIFPVHLTMDEHGGVLVRTRPWYGFNSKYTYYDSRMISLISVTTYVGYVGQIFIMINPNSMSNSIVGIKRLFYIKDVKNLMKQYQSHKIRTNQYSS